MCTCVLGVIEDLPTGRVSRRSQHCVAHQRVQHASLHAMERPETGNDRKIRPSDFASVATTLLGTQGTYKGNRSA